MSDFENVVERYMDAWNEADAAQRAKKVAALWAEDGGYTDPLAHVSGHDSVAAMIAGAREQFPGFTFRPVGGVDAHHDVARFSWGMYADGADEPTVIGFDVAVLAADGRIAHVYGFLDKVPTA